MIESYLTEAATFLIGIGTGIAIRAKIWWKNKTAEERKCFVYEILQSLEDGKITAAEAKTLIKNHL
ncbi:hypothetical protein J2755_001288 [Methanohalophilus levihalophilus]|uniref:SHOCT-like domain-containing protein n=1 Tax=Methanohalophilus levihalophilus TaxID=1431282 RepID=UPI001AE38FB5|nr:hypothetical protein [Methanohalophilus levihalophilus]MBP2030354.1 hypothetical protein [Methanohalophilus levihalophilus]